jgi:hypothetical protein
VYSSNQNIDSNFTLEKWLNSNNIRYYSLARYALINALKILKIEKGDVVALPEFICRDLISAISSVGATAIFYPVNESLNLSSIPKNLYFAKVIIAVNYFGFPQDLLKFKKVSSRSREIIEDNAHGFLSYDSSGKILGTRTPIGIFSLRKTVPLLNGAAIIVNDNNLGGRLSEQIDMDFFDIPFKIKIKIFLRKLVPYIGIWACRLMTNIVRLSRRLKTGSEIPIADINAEELIPGKPNPYFGLHKDLSRLNLLEEISRRRALYIFLDKNIPKHGGVAVFDGLLDGVSPYCYPFRANNNEITTVKKYLLEIHLECNLWPDLPSHIVNKAPDYYKNVWVVSFLW